MDEAAANVKRKGRLQPGKLFLVDLERGVIVDDGEVKREVAAQKPYAQWFEEGIVHLGDLPPAPELPTPEEPLHERQRAFGFTQEDLRVLLAPTAAKAEEPIGSMGNDAALAVLSATASRRCSTTSSSSSRRSRTRRSTRSARRS